MQTQSRLLNASCRKGAWAGIKVAVSFAGDLLDRAA